MEKRVLVLFSMILFMVLFMTFDNNVNGFNNTAFGNNCQEQLSDYTGIYEYLYPYNTETLNENHYIKIKLENKKLKGWYYGTSDDFDSGREGYLPGFFVKEMENFIIRNTSIEFILSVEPEDFFDKPVPLKYQTKEELPANEFEKWDAVNMRFQPKKYQGTIKENQITINTGDTVRVYPKIYKSMDPLKFSLLWNNN